MVVKEDTTYAQVERILNSETLRNAEVLRRLLKFLAEKSLSGEADQLKEYTVGIDALGKPQSYDPRQDSVVRIQIGRLRHKLADYYRTEGKDDPIILEVPKGHFKLTWQPKPVAELPVAILAGPAAAPSLWQLGVQMRWMALAMAVLTLWAVAASVLWWREHVSTAPFREAWTPELEELWRPFLSSNRPLIVAVASPLFVGLQGKGLYRDMNVNTWDEATASPQVQSVRKSLNNPSLFPRYYYTGFGEASAAFQLGKLLNFSGLKIATARSSQISWQQMVDNNVLFVGAPRVFGDQLHKLPVELDFVLEEDGVHDRHAAPGQLLKYADAYPSIAGRDAGSVDDGEIYALISHMPGPLFSGDVQTFNSNHSPGTLASVQWFTNPALVHQLLSKLRKPNGELPRFYQLILKVKYRDAVPTDITYVTHRELHPDSTPQSQK